MMVDEARERTATADNLIERISHRLLTSTVFRRTGRRDRFRLGRGKKPEGVTTCRRSRKPSHWSSVRPLHQPFRCVVRRPIGPRRGICRDGHECPARPHLFRSEYPRTERRQIAALFGTAWFAFIASAIYMALFWYLFGSTLGQLLFGLQSGQIRWLALPLSPAGGGACDRLLYLDGGPLSGHHAEHIRRRIHGGRLKV